MRGPYRTPLFRPPSFEQFWLMLERRRQWTRALPFAGLAFVLVPGLAVVTHELTRSPDQPPETALRHAIFDPVAEPWGLAITPEGGHALTGPLPAGVLRPDLASSPIPASVFQEAIGRGAQAELVGCYQWALKYRPELHGDVVVEIAIRGSHVRVALSQPFSFRDGTGDCVRRAIEAVKFPPVNGDVAWVHFPLRFAQQK